MQLTVWYVCVSLNRKPRLQQTQAQAQAQAQSPLRQTDMKFHFA
jgi:hypothetical protein